MAQKYCLSCFSSYDMFDSLFIDHPQRNEISEYLSSYFKICHHNEKLNMENRAKMFADIISKRFTKEVWLPVIDVAATMFK